MDNFASSCAIETWTDSSFANGQAHWLSVEHGPIGANFADTDFGWYVNQPWLPEGDFATGMRSLVQHGTNLYVS